MANHALGADEVIKRLSAAPRETLQEVVLYAIGGLWGDADGGYDLEKDVRGSDFVEHMTDILAAHQLVPTTSGKF